MTPQSDALLIELLGLHRRYGSRAFREVARALQKGGAVDEIAAAVTAIQPSYARDESSKPSEASRQKKSREKRLSSKEKLELYANDLSLSADRHKAIVGAFARRLAERSVLPTKALLQAFANAIGSGPVHGDVDRYQNARALCDQLLTFSPTEIDEKIELATKMTRPGSSLEAWANVIVRPDPER